MAWPTCVRALLQYGRKLLPSPQHFSPRGCAASEMVRASLLPCCARAMVAARACSHAALMRTIIRCLYTCPDCAGLQTATTASCRYCRWAASAASSKYACCPSAKASPLPAAAAVRAAAQARAVHSTVRGVVDGLVKSARGCPPGCPAALGTHENIKSRTAYYCICNMREVPNYYLLSHLLSFVGDWSVEV